MITRLLSAALGAALLLAAAPASAVTNGGFEDATITPLSGSTPGGLGNFTSGWNGWNNNGLQVDITDASPSTDPFLAGGSHMAHIVSAGLNGTKPLVKSTSSAGGAGCANAAPASSIIKAAARRRDAIFILIDSPCVR